MVNIRWGYLTQIEGDGSFSVQFLFGVLLRLPYAVCIRTVQLALAGLESARYLICTVQLALAGLKSARYLICTVQLALAGLKSALYLI